MLCNRGEKVPSSRSEDALGCSPGTWRGSWGAFFRRPREGGIALENGHNALSEESLVEFGLLVRHATEGQLGHEVV
jgi:hypothetical protein